VGPAGGNFHSDKEVLLVDTIENRTAMITNFLTLI
jgi:di/tripeptidase